MMANVINRVKIAGAMEITATRKIGEGKNNEKPIKRITFRMLGFNQKSFLSNGIVNFKLCQRNLVTIFIPGDFRCSVDFFIKRAEWMILKGVRLTPTNVHFYAGLRNNNNRLKC